MADFLDNIVSAWGDDEVGEEDSYPDETNSPNVNILIRTARKFVDGKVDKETFLDEVYQTLDRLEQALSEHRSLYENPDLSEEVKNYADQADDAYEEFRSGLVEMEDANKENVEQGIETCKRATIELEAANQAFFELQQREQMIECTMCSELNMPTRDKCSKCGAKLSAAIERAAATAQQASSDMVMVPPEYMELFEACDKVASDEIPLEQWQERVDFMVDKFNQASQQIHDHTQRFEAQLQTVPGFLDAAESLVDAMDEALESLGKMQLFSSDGDPEHLNQGWMALLVATQKIQTRGMEFYKILENAEAGAEGAAG